MLEILGNHFLCGLTIANAFNGGEKESKITYLCIRSIAEHLQMTKTHLAARYLNRMKIPHYAKLHLMTALLYLIHECPGI